MPPTVSVVIPLYNSAAYIAEAIDGVRRQTFPDWELIVVDDGSTDDGAAAAERAAADFAGRFTLVRKANGGEPSARNAGLAVARGEWVANTDADDWWEPSKLEKQLAAAAAGPDSVLVHTGVVHHYPDGRIVPLDLTGPGRRVGRCLPALLEPHSICHPSVLVRKAALERIGGYDVSYRQACDIDLYFRLSVVGGFAFVPEHLTHYRIHAGQLSRSPVDQIRAHHRAVRAFFAAHPDALAEIGPGAVTAALAGHVAAKLESLYWQRNLPAFRELLAFAATSQLDSPTVREWRRRGRWPDWAVRLKDRLASRPAGAWS